MTEPEDKIFTLKFETHELVTLTADGRIEYGPDYTPTQAAKDFWAMLVANRPASWPTVEARPDQACCHYPICTAPKLEDSLYCNLHTFTENMIERKWRAVADKLADSMNGRGDGQDHIREEEALATYTAAKGGVEPDGARKELRRVIFRALSEWEFLGNRGAEDRSQLVADTILAKYKMEPRE